MRGLGRIGVVTLLLGSSGLLGAQVPSLPQAPTAAALDSARCDSVVTAARVDSTTIGLFMRAARLDGGELPPAQATLMLNVIGGAFIPPRPFRVSVFTGPARMRLLRPLSVDTATALRVPTVTGIYRFASGKSGAVARLATLRASLVPGFDSAATIAIRDAGFISGVAVPPNGEDSMFVEIRFSTDSALGSRRLVAASFPRLPVLDAVPRRDNPSAEFPDEAKQDSIAGGEVVLRFVVDREGEPAMETIEVVRATALPFLKAAIKVLPRQHFAPATVHGCAVAQLVEYPFSFVAPEPPSRLRKER